MTHYNFLEIGTSNFDTLVERASDTTRGISIEPIMRYLNELPDKPLVKKINAAVSFDNLKTPVKVFYIPEEEIKKHKLPKWTYGCNSINDYHYMHKRDKLEHLVTIEEIMQIPISNIFIDNDITSLDLLKIDTEGGDYKILTHLFNFLKDNKIYGWPKKIIFESNHLTPKEEIDKITEMYSTVGYQIIAQDKENTVIEL